jgi:hypothetical protein
MRRSNARGMFVIVAERESLDDSIELDRLIDRHMKLVGIKCNYIGINCSLFGGKKK